LAKECKPIIIGLDLGRIGIDELEKIALKVQEKILELLEKEIPISKSYDADIIVSLENKGDRIEVYIDIGVLGELEDVIDYDSILQYIIKESRRYVEELLREYSYKTD